MKADLSNKPPSSTLSTFHEKSLSNALPDKVHGSWAELLTEMRQFLQSYGTTQGASKAEIEKSLNDCCQSFVILGYAYAAELKTPEQRLKPQQLTLISNKFREINHAASSLVDTDLNTGFGDSKKNTPTDLIIEKIENLKIMFVELLKQNTDNNS